MSLHTLGNKWTFTQEENKRCNRHFGSYNTSEDAEEACEHDNDCTYVLDIGCDGSPYHLCHRSNSTINTSSDGSCIYQKGNTPIYVERQHTVNKFCLNFK